MILVDSSVWVDHLRHGSRRLERILREDVVVTHPFVIGELACGWLARRKEILDLLTRLPQAVFAEHDEVLKLVDESELYGRGLGWVDAHLLTSAVISRQALWTNDRALIRAAEGLGVATDV